MPVVPLMVALVSLLLFALGWRWMPEGRRRAYAYAGLVAFVLLVVGIAGCGEGAGRRWRRGQHRDDHRELSGRHKLFVVDRKRTDYGAVS